MQIVNNLIVSGSFDKTCKIWDMQKAYCVATLQDHDGPVHSLSMAGKVLVTGSFDRTTKIWDIDSGTCIRSLDSKSLVWCTRLHGSCVASGTHNGDLFIWDTRTFTSLLETNAHEACVTDIAFIHGGCGQCSGLEVSDMHIASGSSDSTVKIWGASHSPSCLCILNNAEGSQKSEVNCMAVDENSGMVMGGSSNGSLNVWQFGQTVG